MPPNTAPHASPAGFTVFATAGASHHVGLADPVPFGLLLPEVPGVGVAFWLIVPIAAVVIDLMARHSDGRIANAEEILRFISTATPARVLLVAAWGFAGYHLFAR